MPASQIARSRRRLLLALLGLATVSIAVPLGYELLGPVALPRANVAWSPAEGWGVVVVAGLAGMLVAVLLRRRGVGRRLMAAAGGAIVVTGALAAGYGVAPGAALGVPACHEAAPPAGFPWQVQATALVDGVVWDRLPSDLPAPLIDGQPLLSGLLNEVRPAAVEDLGIENHGPGTLPQRHCRALVSGSQVTAALPLLADGSAGEPIVPPELPIWRGDFDWWVSQGGELVGARFAVGGHPADAWRSDGLHGQLFVELSLVTR